MAKTPRPKFKLRDRVTLASWTPLIPAYEGKPFVGRDTVLRVSSITGKGSMRDPWFVRVTDDAGNFWTLPPDDLAPAEDTDADRHHLGKRSATRRRAHMAKPPKRPSQRELTLSHLRIAGYDNDRAAWTRLYIEHRISYAVAKKAWEEGVRMREAGIPRNMP